MFTPRSRHLGSTPLLVREEGKRSPQPVNNIPTPAPIPPPPVSNVLINMTSALPPKFTLVYISTALFVLPCYQLILQIQGFDPHPPPLHFHPFNCTCNSLHRHLTTSRSHRLESWRVRLPCSRRCSDFLDFFGI